MNNANEIFILDISRNSYINMRFFLPLKRKSNIMFIVTHTHTHEYVYIFHFYDFKHILRKTVKHDNFSTEISKIVKMY